MKNDSLKREKFGQILRPILGIVLAILINISVNRLVTGLGLPLFVDNIGTLLSAAMGGYLPAIIVGYCTNFLNMGGNIENVYYASISVMIATSAAFLASKGYFKKISKIIITIPVFALIGGVLGSLVTYFIYGYGAGEGISIPFISALLNSGSLNVFWACMLNDFFIDIVDKAITVFASALILKFIPERIQDSFNLVGWRQKPFTKEEIKQSDKSKTRGLSLEVRFTLIVAGIMILAGVFTTTISYFLFHSFAVEQYAATGQAVDELALSSMEVTFVAKVVSLFLGFFFLIIVVCIWLAKYNIVYPINAMTVVAGEFASDDKKERDIAVEKVENLKICTGDEIENLYNSLSFMIDETVEHMQNIREKGEQISKMQLGLITVLADLVESRDKNTGDHVRKTAAYVKLLLNAMKEKGLYPDILTDQYVEDVTNSAPLHDIGKIVVSDAIINKAGRLDDDEFTVMKTHAATGGKIIEHATELLNDSGYLGEAKRLAAYHHEKWDGTGYPDGLKGEEIPLSARVMAVADVFDALMSKRCYKPPFEFDEAVKIIEDGSGKHFDPDVVKVFMENLDAVKEIAKEHEKYNSVV